MPPAARVGDMHTCPLSDGPKPHVGGPIMPPGVPTVLIGGMPAAVVSGMAACAGPPDTIHQRERNGADRRDAGGAHGRSDSARRCDCEWISAG